MVYKNETVFKQALVKDFKDRGFYARRVEDQYAVGTLDLVLVTPTIGTVLAEGKLVRSGSYIASPRQRVEASRIRRAGGNAVLLAYDRRNGCIYIGPVSDRPVRVATCRSCESIAGVEDLIAAYLQEGE